MDERNRDAGISIHTDGSKLSITYRLPDHWSVFKAQITAIKESLLALTRSVLKNDIRTLVKC